jgi:hypothetical protein
MSRVPLVSPNSRSEGNRDDEIARLKAWRDFLLAKIAAEERVRTVTVPTSLRILMLGLIAIVGAILFAGVFSGQIAASFVVWTVAIGGPLMFVLSREVRLFGSRFFVGEFVGLIMQGLHGDLPLGRIGRADLHDQLAQCEAEISRLRERRS